MGGVERARKVIEQIGKISRQRCRPRDQNIVMPSTAMKGKHRRSGGPKPPFCPVAGHRIADLAAGGKSHADMTQNGLWRRAKFQGQAGRRTADAPRGAQEIGAVFRRSMTGIGGPWVGLSGELFAAMRTAARQHLASAGRGHARTESMTPLADDLARLIGALHG